MSKREFTPEEIAKSLRVCAERNRCRECIQYDDALTHCVDALKRKAADMIEAQAKRIGELEAELAKFREENRWISVEERLPGPDDGPYSAYEEEFAVQVLAVIEGAEWATELYFDGYDFFDIQGGEAIPYRVTHWKPMPKGPEVCDG